MGDKRFCDECEKKSRRAQHRRFCSKYRRGYRRSIYVLSRGLMFGNDLGLGEVVAVTQRWDRVRECLEDGFYREAMTSLEAGKGDEHKPFLIVLEEKNRKGIFHQRYNNGTFFFDIRQWSVK